MCRSAAEGGRRCSGRSCGAAGARARQARCRARNNLEAARITGDPDRIAAAEAKYTAVTGTPPPPANVAGQLLTTPEPTAPEKPMPTPEEPKPSGPEPTSTPTGSTENRIRDAVAKLARYEGGWVGLVDLRRMLGDVDHDEVSRALRDMARANPNVHLQMEDNRKALTDADHAAAVDYSGEPQHLIAIEKPRDAGAKDRVQAAGVGNASADDLAEALRDPLTPTQTYDAIRAEQKRRGLA
ncbi:hypothetical protein ACIRSS_50215 [Amycolatopsis sp. NPDC101161]|uniref:hypothetical protein n=1 Tax=Amycolatopsis sp. NPDC101161 TaxID=3363940 RepID=UPI003829693A